MICDFPIITISGQKIAYFMAAYKNRRNIKNMQIIHGHLIATIRTKIDTAIGRLYDDHIKITGQ